MRRIANYLPGDLFVALKSWGWKGDYATWEEAQKVATGYDSENIINKVRESLLKVKNGEAVYERDSVLFDKIEYSWEVLAIIMWVAVQHEGELNLIDFGGSLGSTYYQNKAFIDKLRRVNWNIIEQPSYVDEGIKYFQNEILRFYYSLDDFFKKNEGNNADIILFSSVLQYLDDPYSIIKQAMDHQIKYILVDRTGFTLNEKERITLQKVPDKIYRATYPCRFFSEPEFLSFFKENNYTLIFDFNALDQANIPSVYKGFLFERNA